MPLRNYETVLKRIRKTTTSTGLTVDATLHQTAYQKGLKIDDQQMNQINIHHHHTLPAWNYTIKP